MWKTSTIAICALALSGSFAMAQTYNQSRGMDGANGPAPVRDIGGATANANQTVDGRTSSTSMLSQSNKAQSAAGMSSSNYGNGPIAAQGPYSGSQAPQMQSGPQDSCGNAGAVAITDEFGNRYNCRGDRLRR
jgi:hypothetical protein